MRTSCRSRDTPELIVGNRHELVERLVVAKAMALQEVRQASWFGIRCQCWVVALREAHLSLGLEMVGNSLREERALTEHGFSRLLEWLDDGGADSKGEAYLEMRRRLVSYFDRRNRPSPDELADETLNRIARTLEQDGAIAVRPPARYCYVTARFVFLEDVRKREHANVPLEGPRGTALAIVTPALPVRSRRPG